MALPFVAVALKVIEELEIVDAKANSLVMKFAKMYSPEKMGRIVSVAKTYPWRFKNPTAAFMKAVGEVNRREKS